MSDLKSCSSCGAKFSGGFFDDLCSNCRRTEAQTKKLAGAMRDQAEAQHRLADAAETQAAGVAEGARLTGAAEYLRAQAEAAARSVVAEAQRRLLDKQGEAALASAVSQLSNQGLQQVNTYEQDKVDRQNIQTLFDKIGNAVACIEQGGKDTPHYKEFGYPGEGTGFWDQKRQGVSFVYRFHNLTRALAHLIDLREEVQRIRTWSANQTREATVQKIQEAVAEGKRAQKEMATKTVRTIKKELNTYRAIGAGLLLLTLCLIGAAISIGGDASVFCGFGAMISGLSGLIAISGGTTTLPNGWNDMLDLSGEE